MYVTTVYGCKPLLQNVFSVFDIKVKYGGNIFLFPWAFLKKSKKSNFPFDFLRTYFHQLL